ncbi:MAG: hypothetical protein HC794_01680 [Nitrospiraceae bacterium]|nr:hypothetical protein [Nitrospiraceae bacterium]
MATDGANSELCYLFDVAQQQHYLLAVYIQGTQDDARQYMSDACETVFTAIHTHQLAF